jgi:membrane dipeptidase
VTAQTLHEQAIVFDATCPLFSLPRYRDWWREGGATVVAAEAADDESPGEALRAVGHWHRAMAESPNLRLVTRAEQFAEVKASGVLGVVLHFQNTIPLGRDTDNVWAFAALGVRMVQLTYNVRNFIGDGCDERTDAGLSDFGTYVVQAMNDAGIVVDLTHTGVRTTLDAMEITAAPPVFSHSNARALCPSARNLSDEQIRLLAARGGVVGVNGFPAFVSRDAHPTLDQFIDHVAYIADLVGIAHVGLGLDYYQGMDGVAPLEAAERAYERLVAAGRWKPETYPPPPYRYPQGIERPTELPNLTHRMLERGFSESDVRQVLGLNFVRVFEAAWKA